MNISIRNHIINNFKNSTGDDIKSSITESIKDNEEVTLPGLGVFFEILWKECSDDEKSNIINHLKEGLK